jgi:hypothetical protein
VSPSLVLGCAGGFTGVGSLYQVPVDDDAEYGSWVPAAREQHLSVSLRDAALVLLSCSLDSLRGDALYTHPQTHPLAYAATDAADADGCPEEDSLRGDAVRAQQRRKLVGVLRPHAPAILHAAVLCCAGLADRQQPAMPAAQQLPAARLLVEACKWLVVVVLRVFAAKTPHASASTSSASAKLVASASTSASASTTAKEAPVGTSASSSGACSMVEQQTHTAAYVSMRQNTPAYASSVAEKQTALVAEGILSTDWLLLLDEDEAQDKRPGTMRTSTSTSTSTSTR